MSGLTRFLVAFSFPWHGGKTKCGIRSHKRHKVEKIDLSVLLFQIMKEPISSCTFDYNTYTGTLIAIINHRIWSVVLSTFKEKGANSYFITLICKKAITVLFRLFCSDTSPFLLYGCMKSFLNMTF